MVKNAFWLFIVATVILIAFVPSYTKMQDLRQKNTEYGKQIEILKAKKAKLVEEKRLLEEDPEYLEKVAREKMGLVREGEVVYKIIPEKEE